MHTSRHGTFRSGLVTALLFAVAAGSNVHGADFSAAVLSSPQVKANREQFEAARWRIDAAGRWADPELEGMYSEKRMPDETNPMWEVSLTQPLPRPGERDADRDLAHARLAMADAELQMTAGMVAAEAAAALTEWQAANERIALLQGQLEQTERTLSAVQTRLGAGQGRMSESLTLQSRLTSLRLDIEKESFMAGEAEREVRQLLGLDPGAPLPEYSIPQMESIEAATAPEMHLLKAQQAEARAMKAMASTAGRPMTAVGLRFEREEAGEGNEDTLGVALMTDLPWNGRRYARAEAAAAGAEIAGRDAAIEALQRRLEADRARAQRLADLADRTKATVAENLQRLDREYEAWIESTGATGSMDASSVLMLIDLLERRTMLQMQAIDTEAEAKTGQAALWRYVPLETGEHHE